MNQHTIAILLTVIAHGRNSASKWANSAGEQQYHEAQYTALQRLYRDITDNSRGYSDFNLLCGVEFSGGHITSHNDAKCINIEDLSD